jgi:hypothetical protein
MNWTPYQIKVILHHYSSAAEFENSGAPIYHPTVAELIKAGVLIHENGVLTTTELGVALVKMWCETPLPVRTYVDPRKTEGAA